jgi:hypothetical protein
MSFPRRGALFVTLLALRLVTPASALGAGSSSPKHLLLMLVPSDSDAEFLWSSIVAEDISSRIEELGVAVQLTRVEEGASDPASRTNVARTARETAGAIGCFWMEKSAEGTRLHLVLFGPKTEWTVVRRLDDVAARTLIETMVVIIRASLSVFMMDLDKREENEKPPPPQPTPAPAARPENTAPPGALRGVEFFRAKIGVGYDLSLFATELPPTHGIVFEAAFSVNRLVSLYGGYVVSFPLSYQDDDLSLRSAHHPARIGVSLRTTWWRFDFSGGMALGIDYTTHEQHAARAGISTVEQRGFLQLSVAPAVKFEFWIIDQLGLFVAAGADVLLTRPRYLFERNGTTEVIADPWPAAPRLSLGISWRLWKVKR